MEPHCLWTRWIPGVEEYGESAVQWFVSVRALYPVPSGTGIFLPASLRTKIQIRRRHHTCSGTLSKEARAVIRALVVGAEALMV